MYSKPLPPPPPPLPRWTFPVSFLSIKAFARCTSFYAMIFLMCSNIQVASASDSGGGNLVNGACVESFQEGFDYFPDKITVDRAVHFDVQYFDNFKVVTNSFEGKTYVLVQCGTPAPGVSTLEQMYPGLDVAADVSVFRVPVTRVAAMSTTYLTAIEMLGERDKIVAVKDGSHVSSPCLLKRLDLGLTVDGADMETLEALGVQASFGGGWPPAPNPVGVTEWMEDDPFKISEWVEFYSLWFNREAIAVNIVDDLQARWSLLTASIATLNLTPAVNDAEGELPDPDPASGVARPRVAWTYRTAVAWGGNWNKNVCPSYYCDLVEAAGGQLVSVPAGTADDWGSLTEAEFLAAMASTEPGKQVDVWLYPGDNWDAEVGGASGVGEAFLTQIAAYNNGQVYDIMGAAGPRDWHESRLMRPDQVLSDLISIIHPGLNPVPLSTAIRPSGVDANVDANGGRVWWRNVATEEAGVGATAADCELVWGQGSDGDGLDRNERVGVILAALGVLVCGLGAGRAVWMRYQAQLEEAEEASRASVHSTDELMAEEQGGAGRPVVGDGVGGRAVDGSGGGGITLNAI